MIIRTKNGFKYRKAIKLTEYVRVIILYHDTWSFSIHGYTLKKRNIKVAT